MHLFIDILRNSVLITGLVVVMMMMIESLNIESRGMLFKGLRKTKVGQVVVAARTVILRNERSRIRHHRLEESDKEQRKHRSGKDGFKGCRRFV